MSKVASIARLRDGGTTWALGALKGDDAALERLGGALMQRWQPRRPAGRAGQHAGRGRQHAAHASTSCCCCAAACWRGPVPRSRISSSCAGRRRRSGTRRCSSSSPWRRSTCSTGCCRAGWTPSSRPMAIRSPRAASPAATGRSPSPAGPSGLRERQAARPGHSDLLNALSRAALSADGRLVFAATGVDPGRPLDGQADAFWWSTQTDTVLDEALGKARDGGWPAIDRVVRGAGPSRNVAQDERTRPDRHARARRPWWRSMPTARCWSGSNPDARFQGSTILICGPAAEIGRHLTPH